VPDRTTVQRKALGHAVRTERLARKLTQEELAEKADLSLNWIGVIERGEQSPTLDSILQIAGALKISVRDLFEKARL
jgi:transcriptional regulator with XRE-family HTH domain